MAENSSHQTVLENFNAPRCDDDLGAENTGARGTDWLLTLWYDPDVELNIATEGVRYFVYGHEIAPETFRPHIHLFIQFEDRKRFGVIKRMFGDDCHAELRRGTPQEAKDYCVKDAIGVKEWGVMKELHKGSRSDLNEAVEDIVGGATLSDIVDERPAVFARYSKNLAILSCALFRKEFIKDKVVTVYWGPTGVGKTRTALEAAGPSVYCVTLPSQTTSKIWFDGYIGQYAVILDDFIGQVDFRFMLTLLDKYTSLVEVKGALTPMVAKRIYITSDRDPKEWYPWATETEYKQLLRRLDIISWMKK